MMKSSKKSDKREEQSFRRGNCFEVDMPQEVDNSWYVAETSGFISIKNALPYFLVLSEWAKFVFNKVQHSGNPVVKFRFPMVTLADTLTPIVAAPTILRESANSMTLATQSGFREKSQMIKQRLFGLFCILRFFDCKKNELTKLLGSSFDVTSSLARINIRVSKKC